MQPLQLATLLNQPPTYVCMGYGYIKEGVGEQEAKNLLAVG
jgi:hypothetical protein